MSTALDLIKSSMRLIGALGAGEVPGATEGQDALVVLNSMLDSWSTERLTIFTENRLVFTLNAGQQVYTMGPDPANDFTTARPLRIDNAGVITQTDAPQLVELPIDILNVDDWAGISVKSVTSALPTKLWSDNDYPALNLSFWPIPSVSLNVALYPWQPLAGVPSIQSSITLPPGYDRAIRYNLAVDLAPEYGRQVPEAVAVIAMESKQNLKTVNSQALDMSMDAALIGQDRHIFNWITGV